jgi:hypothetical protein
MELKEVIDNTILNEKEAKLEQKVRAALTTSTKLKENIIKPATKLGEELEVNIDFDEASRAWRENKRSSGNGCYKYVCSGIIAKTGMKCEKVVKMGCAYCSVHNNK